MTPMGTMLGVTHLKLIRRPPFLLLRRRRILRLAVRQ